MPGWISAREHTLLAALIDIAENNGVNSDEKAQQTAARRFFDHKGETKR